MTGRDVDWSATADVVEMVTEKIATWVALRAELANPAYRRDVCFICETAPIELSVQGATVGVCRDCDDQARAEGGER